MTSGGTGSVWPTGVGYVRITVRFALAMSSFANPAASVVISAASEPSRFWKITETPGCGV